MANHPYTDKVMEALKVNPGSNAQLAEKYGYTGPIGECAQMIQSAIWEMESAEREASRAVKTLGDYTKQAAEALDGSGMAFDASWLTHYAGVAAQAHARMENASTRVKMFKHLLDMLVAQADAASGADAA